MFYVEEKQVVELPCGCYHVRFIPRDIELGEFDTEMGADHAADAAGIEEWRVAKKS